MDDAEGIEAAIQVGSVAGDLEPGRESASIIGVVVAGIRGEIVDGGIYVSLDGLVENAGHQVPGAAEVLFDARLGNVSAQVHAGKGLADTFLLRIRGGWQRDVAAAFLLGVGIGEPSLEALGEQRVAAVIQLQNGMFPRAHVHAQVDERTSFMAIGHITLAVAVQGVETIAEDAVAIELPAQIGLRGADTIAGIVGSEFTQGVVSRPFGDHIEYARWGYRT